MSNALFSPPPFHGLCFPHCGRQKLPVLFPSHKPPLSSLLHLSPSLASPPTSLLLSFSSSLLPSNPRRGGFHLRALESSAAKTNEEEDAESKNVGDAGTPSSNSAPGVGSDGAVREKVGADGGVGQEYPTGEFEMEEFDWWRIFVVKVRMLFALPWERVRKGSVLSMRLRGQVSLCVLEKVGIQPEIQRIGRYKSAGDQLSRKSIRPRFALLVYTNIPIDWRYDIYRFVLTYRVSVRRGVRSMLKARLAQKDKKDLLMVNYSDEMLNFCCLFNSKYSNVRKWTLGLEGGKDQIAIIRASGSISRTRSPLSVSGSGIYSEQLIEKIRSIR
ncbi:hypothetical protein BHM03_00039413, partial [Ensete ventricosum]